MKVAELFAWLKANNAKIAFGFKKSIPYVAIKLGGAKMQYKSGKLAELEEALVGLLKEGLVARDAPTQ